MLYYLKNWSIIFLSLTLVITLFHINALIVDFNDHKNEIVVPAQGEETQRVCLSLSLMSKEEIEDHEKTDMLEDLPSKNT